MMKRRLKSKPGVEFQYGGHPFSETGSRFISAMDRTGFLRSGKVRENREGHGKVREF